jgi:small subunit ribosomal protein S20
VYVWWERSLQGRCDRLDSPPWQGYHPRPYGEDIRVANHASAKKRVRQTVKRTARNRQLRTHVRTCVKRVRAAIEAGDADAAKKALIEAVSRIDGAVAKGIYHRKTGSRYISRLTYQVNALQS